MDAATLFDRAADVMLARGKCEHGYIDRRGAVCTIGALALADGAAALASAIDSWYAANWYTKQPGPLTILHDAFGAIAAWSDDHTQDEVIAGLRACAAIERAQEQTPVGEARGAAPAELVEA